MFLQLGSIRALVVSSAEIAKEVLKTHDAFFVDRPTPNACKQVFRHSKDVLFSPYGDHWRKLRGILVHQLLNSKTVKSFTSIIEEETALLVKNITYNSTSPINLKDMFMMFTSDVICRSAFGKKLSEKEHGKRFLKLMNKGIGLVINLTIGEFIPWLSWMNRLNGFDVAVGKIVKIRDEVLGAIIQEHLDSETCGNDGNLIDTWLHICKDETPNAPINMDTVKALILDVMAAATETSAVTLEWAMTELIRHPTVMRKLKDEVRGNSNGQQNITAHDLEKMHYLKAVIKETLRYHPPIPLYSRESREDVDLMKLRHFKGFDFQFIPFGAGRRSCPGISFAIASIEHVLANLIHEFDWELPDGAKGEDLDVTERPGLSVGKKNPLIVVATKKKYTT
ncbi:hypothetical protein RD792_010124 [Penstemon davidsonii]|uniref:Cytochrome P450 n=1 Tax=Penstemon davidsonii TaxID=160366 RepID=A0ABR0D2D4_9LAMI|nr:hypothetical protein RD792_010124 [Penstemon davidsonii]